LYETLQGRSLFFDQAGRFFWLAVGLTPETIFPNIGIKLG